MRTSWLQAKQLPRYANTLSYSLEAGPSEALQFPSQGPFDYRLGYSRLPDMLSRLKNQQFSVTQQVQFSPALQEYTSHGLFPPYLEKTQAGLFIGDCREEAIYDYAYPQRHYSDFSSVAPLVVNTLLFIENRDLLSQDYPEINPAVDWPRFTKAALSQLGRALDLQDDSAGGSTLATQIEKFRHSPGGRTPGAKEKLRQMISASVRAYQNGPDTLAARQTIALAYLNSVPLAAAPGHGEIHGIGDGLWLWFGAELEDVNRLLDPSPHPAQEIDAQGLALRQVIALMIAQRRPSYYLHAGRGDLEQLTDSYLRLQAQAEMITPTLRDAALAQRLVFRNFNEQPVTQYVENSKTLLVTRGRLANLLGMSFYELDRLDLSASTTLNAQLQEKVTHYLQQLADPDVARAIGLYGERLLSPEKTAEVRYSFTLFERAAQAFYVRVQTDNTLQPFDINEGSKLELGSTAKLRAIATYLEIIAELHQQYAGYSPQKLRALTPAPQDYLSRWAISYLLQNADHALTPMLNAALARRYSASTGERFFTGGGLHTFHNFRRQDNSRNPTMIEALRESINLPFIRLMRDIVRYSIYQNEDRAQLLANDKDPRRQEYLSRFADREGRVFLLRFWRKYQNKTTAERLTHFFDGLRPTATRLAAVHRYLLPDASRQEFDAFINERLPNASLSESRLEQLFDNYGPGAYNLPDQGYIARVHPLELWLLSYLQEEPQARFSDAAKASEQQRQEVYGWLFKTRHRSARDSRIRTMLEIEAFSDIHQRWERLGFPFDSLVPSLATAIGSSGDKPVALAELVGIILNEGIRLPTVRMDELHFATATPYETHLAPELQQAKRVMNKEVAAVLKDALSQVVEGGTARRLQGGFSSENGTQLILGGKTGTGDNRIQTVNRHGQVLTSQARNRTATFVFYLGEQHFGTLTAYVPGQASDKFNFTSALPVQVLKGMEPILREYLNPNQHSGCHAPALSESVAIDEAPLELKALEFKSQDNLAQLVHH
nr:transglycosylase domain-containing protein [Oceanisphaera avium]